MKIAVFGLNGQLAHALGAVPGVTCMGRDVADFTRPDEVRRAAAGVQADAIINAVAYTAVDRAESDVATAQLVNATSVGALARVTADRGIPLVHVSTDYVFDGSGDRPFRPGDPTGPLGTYGRTKLAGEEAIRAAAGTHVILRTSWVFSAHGQNFLRTMLRLGAERPALRVVSDQVGGPTPASDLAQACVTIAEALTGEPDLTGTYHCSGAPDVSWADFARAIFAEAGLAVTVDDIPTSAYPTPARRPANSRLDCSTTKTAFGIARPDWRRSVRAAISDLR